MMGRRVNDCSLPISMIQFLWPFVAFNEYSARLLFLVLANHLILSKPVFRSVYKTPFHAGPKATRFWILPGVGGVELQKALIISGLHLASKAEFICSAVSTGSCQGFHSIRTSLRGDLSAIQAAKKTRVAPIVMNNTG